MTALALTAAVAAAVAPAMAATPAEDARTSVWQPKPGTSWQWQIVGRVTAPFRNVSMYDVDLQDAMPSRTRVHVAGFGSVTWPRGVNAGVIDGLHADNRMVICYLDSGAYEKYRPDAGLFPKRAIGNTTGWAGERWLDIRPGQRDAFAPIIWARFRLAKSIGCDGVEPDENNPWGNHPGFPITKSAEKSWYLTVARHAHKLGLSVGMKNGLEVVGPQTVKAFDWALNEECFYFHECGRMSQFVSAGKAVFQAEYVADWKHRGLTSMSAVKHRVCQPSRDLTFSTLVKRVVPDKTFTHC